MDLGETVTCCGLEGVLSCGSIPIQTMCLVPSVWELGLTWMQVMSVLRVCWQLSPWFCVGLEMEGLELAPGVRQVFLSAQ